MSDTDDTPTTTALIEKMLCEDGIPQCSEWSQLEAHARVLERALRGMVERLCLTDENPGDVEAIACAKEILKPVSSTFFAGHRVL